MDPPRKIHIAVETSGSAGISRYDAPPGVPCDPNRPICFNNASMTLTYKTHLPKQVYKDWFLSHVIPTYTKGSAFEDGKQEVLFLEMAHETGDKNDPYLHTHVVYQCKVAITTRNAKALDYEGIHPNWTYITDKTHMKRAKAYLAKEDPENIHLKDNTQAWKQQVANSLSPKEALEKVDCSPSAVPGLMLAFKILRPGPDTPVVVREDFFRWQLQVLDIMDKNSKVRPKGVRPKDTAKPGEDVPILGLSKYADLTTRMIHLVVDPVGGAGKTAFVKALQHMDPKRFLVCQGVPQMRDFATIAQNALEVGWTGDSVLFNLTRQQVDNKIHATLEASIDGFITATKYTGGTCTWTTRNLWIFTNDIPCLTKVSIDRWRIFSVSANWSKDYISWLIPMSLQDAMTKRETFLKDRGLTEEDIEDPPSRYRKR